MHDFHEQCQIGSVQRRICGFFFFKTIYKKPIIRFAFRDIGNNQRLGKCYQLWALARLITLTSTLKIPDISKSHPIIAYKLIKIV